MPQPDRLRPYRAFSRDQACQAKVGPEDHSSCQLYWKKFRKDSAKESSKNVSSIGGVAKGGVETHQCCTYQYDGVRCDYGPSMQRTNKALEWKNKNTVENSN